MLGFEAICCPDGKSVVLMASVDTAETTGVDRLQPAQHDSVA